MAEDGVILKEPLTWDVFLLLPDAEQEEYLQHLINRFHVTCGMIAQDLFEINQKTLIRHIEKRNMKVDRGKGGRIPVAMSKRWHEWVSGRRLGMVEEGEGQRESATNVFAVEEADVPKTVSEVVANMQEAFGKIRVTITIEPI